MPPYRKGAGGRPSVEIEEDFCLAPCHERLAAVIGDGLLEVAVVLKVFNTVGETLDGAAQRVDAFQNSGFSFL